MLLNKIKLVIVDDHPLIIQGLQVILHENFGIDIVGAFNTGNEALAFLKSNKVDIVLLDITLADMSGISFF